MSIIFHLRSVFSKSGCYGFRKASASDGKILEINPMAGCFGYGNLAALGFGYGNLAALGCDVALDGDVHAEQAEILFRKQIIPKPARKES